ncbi:MAG: UDP-N-acetylmuramoylalanyl-D-glutamyl-2,6-diaminopimelate--D-alanyl-D-alanine ligase [Alphaproteobacteria bacterium]|nr:UDP-N-acetylmuramoylalanyl-D-glutamyl-2,6-diaminopimelate--D-alanyl-D-alanine ligase [Alphaproteobacteria bacterium]
MGAPLWSAAEIAAATSAVVAGDWSTHGVSIDSRTVKPGEVYVAIKGGRLDGHDFVAAALNAGAVAAMVARRPAGLERDARLILVGDTLAGLEALGRAARARSQARVIAVTGSVGKTSTKEMLRLALARSGETYASEGNLNNTIGAPLSLSRLPPTARFAVFELGMNHAGEIAPISRLTRPHVAVITTVEAVHLEFFSSVEAIADAKAEIFEGLEPGGTAVLNRDNPYFARLSAAARAKGAGVVGFGEHESAEARLVRHVLHPGCVCISADILGEPVTYKVGAPGRHWAMNSLAALAAVKLAGGDLALAAVALAEMKPLKGRGLRRKIEAAAGAFLLIDDSYNASPVAMRAAFDALAAAEPAAGGRRIAVLGDMLELGPDARRLHAELAADIAAQPIDLVFACGPLSRALYDALPASKRGAYAADSAALAPVAARAMRPGDAVLVKGSLGSKMAAVVAALDALAAPAPKAA